MNESNLPLSGPVARSESLAADFASKVYGWTAAGVIASAMTAYWVQSNPSTLASAERHITLWIFLPFAPLLLLMFIGRQSAVVGGGLFTAFCAIEGVSLGVIVSFYTTGTVALALGTTAGLFVTMAVIGSVTKRDLTHMANILLFALIALIIASFANIFFASTGAEWVITYVGIAIFLGFSAYDAQRVKKIALSGDTSTASAIWCATSLYLDILNLFLFLLRVFGRSN
jgi:hypothetical protein